VALAGWRLWRRVFSADANIWRRLAALTCGWRGGSLRHSTFNSASSAPGFRRRNSARLAGGGSSIASAACYARLACVAMLAAFWRRGLVA